MGDRRTFGWASLFLSEKMMLMFLDWIRNQGLIAHMYGEIAQIISTSITKSSIFHKYMFLINIFEERDYFFRREDLMKKRWREVDILIKGKSFKKIFSSVKTYNLVEFTYIIYTHEGIKKLDVLFILYMHFNADRYILYCP